MPAEMRRWSRSLKTTGVLDIVIDETGRVVDATMRQSVNSAFDAPSLRSARRWKYRPATKDGAPVRYLKTNRPGAVTREDPMYERFYGFREVPFELTANPKFLFFTAQHREALCHLEYGLSAAKP